ncbi:MAG: hypothetical protein ACR2OZ_00840 [Verrucomicrobiales bacterium]
MIVLQPKYFLAALAVVSLPEFSARVSAQGEIDAARGAMDQSTIQAQAGSLDQAGTGPMSGASEHAPKMEGDEEFGVQRVLYRRSNWEPFNVRFDLSSSYTSNVALVSEGEQDDWFLRSGIQFSYTPQLKGGLFFSTTFSDQVYRYADASFLTSIYCSSTPV